MYRQHEKHNKKNAIIINKVYKLTIFFKCCYSVINCTDDVAQWKLILHAHDPCGSHDSQIVDISKIDHEDCNVAHP